MATQFRTLDALRGIAAIGVMLFHAPKFGSQWMPGGYLAVDLFFMLSGAVIAHAYRERMAGGMTRRSFAIRRAQRLWPMLALGAALGIILHGGFATSLFLIPNVKSPSSLFPANPPFWSLLFEAIAYCAFAFGLWRAGPRLLGCLALIAGAALAWLTATSPYLLIDFGAHWQTPGGGLARVGFGFVTGMLIWYLWQKAGRPSITGNRAWLLAAAIIAIMAAVPQTGGTAAVLAIVLAFPAITWLALRWEVPQTRIARALGNLSYPLYCIHMPLLMWMAAHADLGPAHFALLAIAALLIERWIDRPARSWLARMGKPAKDHTRIGIST